MANGVQILLAEDDEMLAELWQRAFERAGYTVTLVTDGGAAIDWLVSNPLPDVLIVDYHMPKANGVKVIETLNALEGGAAVTKVMATADHTIMFQAAESVDMFLQKPIRFKEMRTLVERLVKLHDTA